MPGEDLCEVPYHVAIVMDGNGRWAQRRKQSRIYGHKKGVEALRRIIECCGFHGVSILTLFAFSSENWRRPPAEVTGLKRLLFSSLAAEADSLVSNGVRLRVIGDLGPFGTDVLHLVQDTERRTASNHKLELVIAVNYGGRWDIVSACRRLAMKAVEGKLSCDAIDEQCVSEALSTSTLPDPDLCIRTGGEYRISNFLLWQLAYTELYFTETLWPEFTEDDFVEALNWYATRQRRFGKIQEQVKVS